MLLADSAAGVIGAAHAGWKGALGGILEATVDAMVRLGAKPQRMMVGIGPRIAQRSYEVGPEFRERFLAESPEFGSLFAPGQTQDRFLFDLTAYLAGRLRGAGISRIQVAPNDTAGEEGRFFSYRRSCLRGRIGLRPVSFGHHDRRLGGRPPMPYVIMFAVLCTVGLMVSCVLA